MGIINHIASSYDEQSEKEIVFVITNLDLSSRANLNRAASRAAVGTSYGQRELAAAAMEERDDFDMVFREGPFSVVDITDKFPKSKDIEYNTFTPEETYNLLSITNIPKDAIPRGRISDIVIEGIESLRPNQRVHIWKIPRSK